METRCQALRKLCPLPSAGLMGCLVLVVPLFGSQIKLEEGALFEPRSGRCEGLRLSVLCVVKPCCKAADGGCQVEEQLVTRTALVGKEV